MPSSLARACSAATRLGSLHADEGFSAFGTTLLFAASMTLIAVPLGAVLALLMVRTYAGSSK
jgi:hypothetical protein